MRLMDLEQLAALEVAVLCLPQLAMVPYNKPQNVSRECCVWHCAADMQLAVQRGQLNIACNCRLCEVSLTEATVIVGEQL